MIGFKLFGAAAMVFALLASPASAQRMIDEPGTYAFYHPYGDLGLGSARPPADALAMVPARTMHNPMVTRHRKSGR